MYIYIYIYIYILVRLGYVFEINEIGSCITQIDWSFQTLIFLILYIYRFIILDNCKFMKLYKLK